MIKGKKVIAVIPARGGSKAVPGKNIRDLNGKPLIAYTIRAAMKSKYLDRVIVSTDSKEIAEISKKFGAEVPFLRPAHLATDTAHTPPVIEHAVDFVESQGEKADIVVTLQPTSPLRTTEQIDSSIEIFMKSDFESVITIEKAFPPYWMFKKVSDERVVPFVQLETGESPYNLERQQLPPVYKQNGAVYVTKRMFLKENDEIISSKNCGFLMMDELSSLDIDTEVDFKVVESVIKDMKRTRFSLLSPDVCKESKHCNLGTRHYKEYHEEKHPQMAADS